VWSPTTTHRNSGNREKRDTTTRKPLFLFLLLGLSLLRYAARALFDSLFHFAKHREASFEIVSL